MVDEAKETQNNTTLLSKKIEQLREKLNCTTQQATQILNILGENVENVLSIIEEIQQNKLYVIKGLFRCEESRICGAFIVFVNIVNKRLERLKVVVFPDQEIDKIEIQNNWESFDAKIQKFRSRKESIIVGLTQHVENEIKELFSQTPNIYQVLEVSENGFKELIQERLANAINDETTSVEFNIDKIAISSDSKPTFDMEASQIGKAEVGQSAIILNVSLVYAPMSGVNVGELTKDEKILVKIVDESELGVYLAELMGARKDGELFPIIANFDQLIPVDNGKFKLRVKLGPQIYGEALVANSVKVKRALPRIELQEIKKDTAQKNTNISPIILLLLAIIFLIYLFLKG